MDDFKISDIISNEGFKKVAYAIRKSTVTLQYTPKDKRKYEIRYGLAQILQNKSKTSSDLAEFIGSFIATYNAETARFVEHIKNKETQIEETKVYPRANVKEKELTLFYELLDKYPSNVIGALLASYGFALTDKEASKQEEDQDGLEVEIQNDEEKRY